MGRHGVRPSLKARIYTMHAGLQKVIRTLPVTLLDR